MLPPARPGDVGHDLQVVITEQTPLERLLSRLLKKKLVVVWPLWGTKTIRSGIRLEMPRRLWAFIRPRSSISRKKLQILGGVIDSDFRGELLTVVHNFGPIPRIITDGSRVAQVIFFEAKRPEFFKVDAFRTVTERNEGGFGHTGE